MTALGGDDVGQGYLKISGTAGLLSVIIIFFITSLLSSQHSFVKELEGVVREEASTLVAPQGVTLYFTHQPPSPMEGFDENTLLSLKRSSGTVDTLTLKDYLWGVVAAEMPASFPIEALKAQTVAARTYTLLRLSQGNSQSKHGGADLCDDSGCCQAYIDVGDRLASWGGNAPFYQAKIQQAVTETDGLSVLYDGNLIDAVFFSSTDGQTLDAQEVWGANLPYLTSVSSPEGEEVPNYRTEVFYTPEEVREKLTSSYGDLWLGQEVDQWIVLLGEEAVPRYQVGNQTLSATQVRWVFGLRSSSFEIEVTEDGFVFSVTGYGHAVGMSQYGAQAMAQQGSLFDEILTWYYTGTTVEVWKK